MKSRTRTLLITLIFATLATVVGLFVAPFVEPASAQSYDGCVMRPPVVPGRYIVDGIPLDDPDGGLVMRSGPGVGSPRVGVLPPLTDYVLATGQCWTSPTGSGWYQVWTGYRREPVWVSSNFLSLVPPSFPAPSFPAPSLPAPSIWSPPSLPPFPVVPPVPPMLACQPGPCLVICG